MNEINSLLTLVNDNNPEVHILVMKHLIEKEKFAPQLKKAIKKAPPQTKEAIKKVLTEKKCQQQFELLTQAFKESSTFDLYKAITNFKTLLSSTNDKKINLFDTTNNNTASLINYGKIYKNNAIKPTKEENCDFEDLTFEHVQKNNRAHIIILYSLMKKSLQAHDITIQLISNEKGYLFYDADENVTINSKLNWQEAPLPKDIQIYNDYALFVEFIMKSYWFNLVQGDLNVIYKINQIMKRCFSNYKLGYPFE